ncbi:MAG: hypothetical protein ACLFVO_19970 [Chloroflexaceae bacterium]
MGQWTTHAAKRRVPTELPHQWRGQRRHISAVSFALWIAQNICELPQVRLEAADNVPAAAHEQVLPGHIIVYGDYIAGGISKISGHVAVGSDIAQASDESSAQVDSSQAEFDQRGQQVNDQTNAGRDVRSE